MVTFKSLKYTKESRSIWEMYPSFITRNKQFVSPKVVFWSTLLPRIVGPYILALCDIFYPPNGGCSFLKAKSCAVLGPPSIILNYFEFTKRLLSNRYVNTDSMSSAHIHESRRKSPKSTQYQTPCHDPITFFININSLLFVYNTALKSSLTCNKTKMFHWGF